MPDAENPLMRDLLYTEAERPIVAQLFSSNPEAMAYAAELCARLGFDGIDINMGCPDKSIEKQGCGAAMIRTPEKAKEIIRAAREGAARGKDGGLPVSVKTRIGYNAESMDEWLPAVLSEKPAALTVHLRTRKEMSKVPAHWELMPRAVALRDLHSPGTRILGNGDVASIEDARAKVAETGCDGIMLGRAIFGNPWLFGGRTQDSILPAERLEALRKLAERFQRLKPAKHFHILKKHFKAFVHGWPGAPELRGKLLESNSFEEFESILSAYEP
jgi:tRNA-dihydrouridine synthase